MFPSRLQRRFSLALVCVAAGAGPALAADAPSQASPEVVAPTKLEDISGRWQGRFRAYGAKRSSCTGEDCNRLTLDVSRCGSAWCGVVVPKEGGCGETAMRLDGPRADGREAAFTGTLKLAEGTEPYTVRTSGIARDSVDPATMWIIGDTGGELRMFRRSFPFEATMARQGDAVCKPEQKTS